MLLQTLVRTWDLAKLYGFVLHASDAMDGNLQFTIMVMDSLKQKEMSGIWKCLFQSGMAVDAELWK
jgi:hypothetical protein